ncbi:MAG TPA: PqqD family protein [Thermoanaerobaculia bacterium]|jgi:hypothetical protein
MQRAPNVIFKQVGDELVLLDFDGAVYYGLDEVGARIWQLLGETESIDGIVETLAGEYETTRETLRADVERLLGELAERGLVR